MDSSATPAKTYIVEHLDAELGPWSTLEYLTIASECHAQHARFLLSSVPSSLQIPDRLKSTSGFVASGESVEVSHRNIKHRICLLDPAAERELEPSDGDEFDVFLFGGILGELADPKEAVMADHLRMMASVRSLNALR